MLRKIRGMFAFYFRQKSVDYYQGYLYYEDYPTESFGKARGDVCLAMSEFYTALSEAFNG